MLGYLTIGDEEVNLEDFIKKEKVKSLGSLVWTLIIGFDILWGIMKHVLHFGCALPFMKLNVKAYISLKKKLSSINLSCNCTQPRC